MALAFGKKTTAAPSTPAAKAPDSNKSAAPTGTPGKTPSFMKTGAAAQAALAHEDAKQEAAKLERGKMFRYRLKENESGKITFLDGDLDDAGMLDAPMFYEHAVKKDGKWGNYVCTQESEGHCPICDMGDHKSSFVAVFTVLDHTPYKVQNGPNAGKTIVNQRRLFVAKRETFKLLGKLGAKRGGLKGCTFEATRGNEKTAAVGNSFDFEAKHTLEEIAAEYGLKPEEVLPADYSKEITFLSAQELVDLGMGKALTGPGHSAPAAKSVKENL